MSRRAGDWKAKLVFGGSALAVAGAAFGLYRAVHSPLFTLRVVEVADQPAHAPVDAGTLAQLADAPVGRENLFMLDLQDIAARIQGHPWIREVHLKKRFPQTLSIDVTFRQPLAMIQDPDGTLSYVDGDGSRFGQVNLAEASDLPVLTGFDADGGEPRLSDALGLLQSWDRAGLAKLAPVSSVAFEAERGYRLLVSYGLGTRPGRGRAMVELGQDFDGELEPQLQRLVEVFQHLSRSGAAARQIWADAGKKIVVKIARGS